eukprot:1505191-Rhodomonas_salina.1
MGLRMYSDRDDGFFFQYSKPFEDRCTFSPQVPRKKPKSRPNPSQCHVGAPPANCCEFHPTLEYNSRGPGGAFYLTVTHKSCSMAGTHRPAVDQSASVCNIGYPGYPGRLVTERELRKETASRCRHKQGEVNSSWVKRCGLPERGGQKMF